MLVSEDELETTKRLRKAEKHLNKSLEAYENTNLEKAADGMELFLIRARSAFDLLEDDFRGNDGFQEWYDEHDEMIENGKGIRKLRNYVTHEGELRIGSMMKGDFGPDIDLDKGEINFRWGCFFYDKKRRDTLLDSILLEVKWDGGKKVELVPAQMESSVVACFWPEESFKDHIEADDAYIQAENYLDELKSLVDEAAEKFSSSP